MRRRRRIYCDYMHMCPTQGTATTTFHPAAHDAIPRSSADQPVAPSGPLAGSAVQTQQQPAADSAGAPQQHCLVHPLLSDTAISSCFFPSLFPSFCLKPRSKKWCFLNGVFQTGAFRGWSESATAALPFAASDTKPLQQRRHQRPLEFEPPQRSEISRRGH